MNYIVADYKIKYLTDKEIMNWNSVYVAYVSKTRRNNLEDMNEILGQIREGFPKVDEGSIKIRVITKDNSLWYDGHLALKFLITAEEFIRLRDTSEIEYIDGLD